MREKRSIPSEKEKNYRGGVQIQSVSRALEILKCFIDTPEYGISDLSAELGLHKSTVYGLVNTLVSYGYLEQIESTRNYRLGMTLFEMGNLVLNRIDIRSEAKECCLPLAEKYPATVHIATHNMGEVIYMDKIDCNNSLISASNIGKRAPMHCTGVGKAMLAFLPEDYMERYLQFPLEEHTPNTIKTKEELLTELAEIRCKGIAMDREEIEEGLSCIAAPILEKDGLAEMAISLSFPYGRIKHVDLRQVKKELLDCAHKLSGRLGYRA